MHPKKNYCIFSRLRPFQAFLSKNFLCGNFDISHWPCIITMLSGQCGHTKGMISLWNNYFVLMTPADIGRWISFFATSLSDPYAKCHCIKGKVPCFIWLICLMSSIHSKHFFPGTKGIIICWGPVWAHTVEPVLAGFLGSWLALSGKFVWANFYYCFLLWSSCVTLSMDKIGGPLHGFRGGGQNLRQWVWVMESEHEFNGLQDWSTTLLFTILIYPHR